MPPGKRPTPTNILRLAGSWRAKTRPKEPKLEVRRLIAPEFLKTREKDLFNSMSEKLFNAGILTEIDSAALVRYCTILGRWMDAEMRLAAGMLTHIPLKDEKNKVRNFMPTPDYMVANKTHEQLLKLEAEFGLTPASRPRLHAEGATDSGIAKILREIR